MTESTNNVKKEGFSQGIGRWLGTAEVYDGHGRFLGNATDQRHVQRVVGEDAVRIDLSFVGPFKFAGHYTIADRKTHRLYQGPANYGYAETLSNGLIDANAYWPVTGLSQRFFLMVLPDGDRQLSLALMSRGEQLIYVVVGDYVRVNDEGYLPNPTLLDGTSYDLADDPAGGRGQILMHRLGRWSGTLTQLDEALEVQQTAAYTETVSACSPKLAVTIETNAFGISSYSTPFKTNGWQAWTPAGEVVGSYSLSGGRALSGHFHHLEQNLRVWRREVINHDGTIKAVLHNWYRGGVRVGVQFGVLTFEAAA
ncbi:MAG: hypothetical protein KDE51_02850 [Anaerolineales bacterium]|nr:hypothetical protein [Anaerolineales bacterium]